MKVVFTPENEVDLAFVKGLLDEAGMRYFVQNDHFGSLYIGPVVPLFNAKAVMVAPQDEGRARAVIEAFAAEKAVASNDARRDYSWKDLLRVFLEIFVFGWGVPGRGGPRRWRRLGTDEERPP